MSGRPGRERVYVPSCGGGPSATLRHCCPPGGRVLMPPVDDGVVLPVAQAAGLRPVQAPSDPFDGPVDAVPGQTGVSLSAVLTTNLYGTPAPRPRARRDALGVPLPEGGAHVIGSEAGGRPAGARGEASVPSPSEQADVRAGAVLPLAGPGPVGAVRSTCGALLTPPRPASGLARPARPYAEAAVRGPGTAAAGAGP
ncbi:hypothetical protein KYY02_00930 [Streptomyces pimonensis]|uniref:Uncharacterized protein n=1 Tax=Streptomyces pimonensis TaxID=2860288 RepID=A0ABV4IVU7_9ACTN